MTFSVVARSADGRALGVAVASKFLGVGAAVPAAEVGAGAVATQALANLAYRPDGLALLRDGTDAAEVVRTLTDSDEQRAQRQLGVVDAAGGAASFTGADCQAYAGSRTGDGLAVQGNILVGPEVLDAMVAAWEGSDPAARLGRRLLAALVAGDGAGGDRRGRQSAALLVVSPAGGYGGTSDIEVDLRVDDHPSPVDELARLLDLHDLYFGRPDPETLLPLEGELAAEVDRLVTALGRASFREWVGVENFEDRDVDGSIDPVVLDRLRAAAAAAQSITST